MASTRPFCHWLEVVQALAVCDDDEEFAAQAIDIAAASSQHLPDVLAQMVDLLGCCPSIRCDKLLLPGRRLCKSCRATRDRW